MKSYLGVDLHYKQVTYHMIAKDKDGKIIRKNGTVPTSLLNEKFIPLLNEETHVCVEATGTTYAFINTIKEKTDKIHVVNPQDFKEISCSGKKTDRIDAKKLANRLKMHIEDCDPDDGFPSVYIPDKEVQQLRKLFSTYEFINKQVVGVKNRISSFFRNNLAPIPKFSLSIDVVDLAEKYDFAAVDIFQIKLLSDMLFQLQSHKEKIRNKIIILGLKRFPDEIKLLITIPGISDFTACSIMVDVVNVRRFKNNKKFASYLRSAPRVHSSDSVVHLGKINKKGRKLSFKYMIQGVTHFKRTNPILSDFYARKGNGKSKGKVRAAIIRKIIVTIYFMLKNNESYRFCNNDNFLRKLRVLEKISKTAA